MDMIQTHCRFNAFYPKLILQGDRQTMKRSHDPPISFIEFVKFGSTTECLVNEYLSQAVCLGKSSRYSAEEDPGIRYDCSLFDELQWLACRMQL